MVNHVAIIMDGNDRWSASKGLKTYDGHRAGAENALKITRAAIGLGIKHLSLFAFSSENFCRPKDEVTNFINLLDEYAISELSKLEQYKIRVHFVGELSKFGNDIEHKLKKAEFLSKNNDNINLYILINYGSRSEIISACKRILDNKIIPDEINELMLEENFYCPSMPDVDLLIRTGDQMRISNFLLWQSAYAELYFSKKLWPEFTLDDLHEALNDYSKRKRTFGLRDVK